MVLCALALSGALAAERAQADSALPAVSQANFNAWFGSGVLTGVPGGDLVAKTRGSADWPLTHETGFQLDWVLASVGSGHGFWGAVGGHWFRCDPSRGLFGIYGDWNSFVGLEYWTIALEGEAYFERLTFAGAVGFQSNSSSTIWADLRLLFYPSDNDMIFGGYRHSLNGNSALIGFEHLLGSGDRRVALYADGVVNDRSIHQAVGGLKFYFGPDKGLIRRHREDDPINRLHPAGTEVVFEETE